MPGFDVRLGDTEDGMLVGIEGHRLAVVAQIARQHLEIGECALRRHEAHLLDHAGRVIDRDNQRAGSIATFEPAMVGPVDLDQRAKAFPAQPRPMEHAPLRPRQPQTLRDHPFAQRLARDMHATFILPCARSKIIRSPSQSPNVSRVLT